MLRTSNSPRPWLGTRADEAVGKRLRAPGAP